MNLQPSFTSLHSYVSYKFSDLRMRARLEQLWSRITGIKSTLPMFPGQNDRISPSRKLLGIKDIRVAEIVGTLNRETDFDSQFRPLKKHNEERWINIYILNEQDGWSPIVVHKVGEQYFVEDGHHRVSVARAIGMEFIEAKVWEYAIQPKPAEIYEPAICCMEKHPSKACMTG